MNIHEDTELSCFEQKFHSEYSDWTCKAVGSILAQCFEF